MRRLLPVPRLLCSAVVLVLSTFRPIGDADAAERSSSSYRPIEFKPVSKEWVEAIRTDYSGFREINIDDPLQRSLVSPFVEQLELQGFTEKPIKLDREDGSYDRFMNAFYAFSRDLKVRVDTLQRESEEAQKAGDQEKLARVLAEMVQYRVVLDFYDKNLHYFDVSIGRLEDAYKKGRSHLEKSVATDLIREAMDEADVLQGAKDRFRWNPERL